MAFERNPFFNAEGYADPTAYKAIYRGGYSMATWKDGDVVKLVGEDGRELYRLLLKAHAGYATSIFLFDDVANENDFEIVLPDGLTLHADIGKFGYTTYRNLDGAELVMNLGEDKKGALRERVASLLGITEKGASQTDLMKVQVERDVYKNLYTELLQKMFVR